MGFVDTGAVERIFSCSSLFFEISFDLYLLAEVALSRGIIADAPPKMSMLTLAFEPIRTVPLFLQLRGFLVNTGLKLV